MFGCIRYCGSFRCVRVVGGPARSVAVSVRVTQRRQTPASRHHRAATAIATLVTDHLQHHVTTLYFVQYSYHHLIRRFHLKQSPLVSFYVSTRERRCHRCRSLRSTTATPLFLSCGAADGPGSPRCCLRSSWRTLVASRAPHCTRHEVSRKGVNDLCQLVVKILNMQSNKIIESEIQNTSSTFSNWLYMLEFTYITKLFYFDRKPLPIDSRPFSFTLYVLCFQYLVKLFKRKRQRNRFPSK